MSANFWKNSSTLSAAFARSGPDAAVDLGRVWGALEMEARGACGKCVGDGVALDASSVMSSTRPASSIVWAATRCWLALDESCAVAAIGASRAWCPGKERSEERDLWNNARLHWSATGGGVQAAHCVMRSRKPLCAAKASKEPCVRIPAGRRRAWQRRRLCIGRRHSSCP